MCRGIRKIVSREARGLGLPRLATVSRGSRVYTPQAVLALRVHSGLRMKDCSAFFFLRGGASGELIFTRRPHFYIDKRKR